MNDTYTFYWLIGILEGEGSFFIDKRKNVPVISVTSTDEPVTARVAKIFGTAYFRYVRKEAHKKPEYQTRLRGYGAAQLMLRLLPYMSPRRQGQIRHVLQQYNKPIVNERIPLTPLEKAPYEPTQVSGYLP